MYIAQLVNEKGDVIKSVKMLASSKEEAIFTYSTLKQTLHNEATKHDAYFQLIFKENGKEDRLIKLY